MTLSKGQELADKAIMAGENVFLTGEAGTGKSYVIKEFLKHTTKRVLVCAPTGVAAINVGGVTLHRAFHIPIKGLNPDKALKTTSAVSSAQVIVIDEISMCRLDVFAVVSSVLMNARKPKQLVVVGDFFQLPPVLGGREKEVFHDIWGELFTQSYGFKVTEPFAFMTRMWDEFKFHSIILTEPMRQRDDGPFLDALNRIRVGDPTALQWVMDNAAKEPREGAIYLCGRNDTAFRINSFKLQELPTESKLYLASKTGDIKSSDVPVEDEITLKVGCRIMTVINDNVNSKFVNGSLGTVTKMQDGFVIVDFDNGSKDVEIYPYEWEICNYETTMKNVRQIRDIIGKTKKGSYKFSSWRDLADDETFTVPDGLPDGEEVIRIYRKKVLSMVPVGNYKQLPLKLAYAVTIHKSQGQTYDAVTLNPECFSSGQLYVALSRVRRISDLYLETPIYQQFLRTSAVVKKFYQRLEQEEKARNSNLRLPDYAVSPEEMELFKKWWECILAARKGKQVSE